MTRFEGYSIPRPSKKVGPPSLQRSREATHHNPLPRRFIRLKYSAVLNIWRQRHCVLAGWSQRWQDPKLYVQERKALPGTSHTPLARDHFTSPTYGWEFAAN